jgi:hypothetical protein
VRSRRADLPLVAALAAVTAVALTVPVPAQVTRVPTVRVVSAPKLTLPGRVDSNNPLVWHRDGAAFVLTAMTSWGGVPELARGASLDRLGIEGGVTFTTHPGHGVWFEAIVTDDHDQWYGFYHHERPADDCGRPDRQLPRIGAARSTDFGRTWDDLGIVLDAPPESAACVHQPLHAGGVVTNCCTRSRPAVLYLYFSQHGRDPTTQASPWRGWRGPIATPRPAA